MPRTTNGAVTRAPDVDLDALFGHIDLSPVVVRMAGETYEVRRDLKMAEIRQYWERAKASDDAGCLALLVGEEKGAELNTALEALPHVHQQAALKQIMMTAGLIEDSGDAAGEA